MGSVESVVLKNEFTDAQAVSAASVINAQPIFVNRSVRVRLNVFIVILMGLWSTASSRLGWIEEILPTKRKNLGWKPRIKKHHGRTAPVMYQDN